MSLKRVMRSVLVAIAVVGIILGQTAGNGSTAVACSLEDCPGTLIGSAGQVYVHYQDNIYLLFDDGRDTLANFDPAYDFYDVYLYADGVLSNANNGENAGPVTFSALNIYVGEDLMLWYDYLDIPADVSVGLVWNRRYTSGADIYYFLRGIQEQDYYSDNSIIQLVMYNSSGQYCGLVDNVHLSIDYWDNELSTLEGCNKFYDTYRPLIDNGQYNPYRIMGDYGTTVRIRISASYSAMTPSDQPTPGTSDRLEDASSKIDNAIADSPDVSVDVDNAASALPDVSDVDDAVLGQVKVLAAPVLASPYIISLCVMGCGFALLSYVLFGKKGGT